MINRFKPLVFLLLLAWPFTALPGWSYLKTPSFLSAEVKGEYLIFVSHALDMEGIWMNRSNFNDEEYLEEEFNWIYGLGMGLPFNKKFELGFWLYGPFWSIWPVTATPTGLELQAKLPLYRKGGNLITVIPAYVYTWGNEDYNGKKDHLWIHKLSSRGFRLPVTLTFRKMDRIAFSLSADAGVDWMTVQGETAYPYGQYISKNRPFAHGGVNCALEHQVRSVAVILDLGCIFYEGHDGRLRSQITYGAALSTVW